jgi:integrase
LVQKGDDVKSTRGNVDAASIQKLIENSRPKYAVLFALAAGTGMRLGEILSLKIDDRQGSSWDYAASMIRVRQSVYKGSLQLPKRSASIRDVDLCRELNELLSQFTSGRMAGFLFTANNQTPLSTEVVYENVLGIKGVLALRQFRVSWLRKKKVPKKLISFWIGESRTSEPDYSQLKHLALRKEIAENVGVGFELNTVRLTLIGP